MLLESDATFIDNLSTGITTAFRNDVWNPRSWLPTVTASATKRLPKVVSENIEASSSGKVSAAFVCALSDAPAPSGLSLPFFFQDNNSDLLSFTHKQSCPKGGSTRRQP